MLGQRGIKPEKLPPAEDIKKLERRVKSQEKKLVEQAGKLFVKLLALIFLPISKNKCRAKGYLKPTR